MLSIVMCCRAIPTVVVVLLGNIITIVITIVMGTVVGTALLASNIVVIEGIVGIVGIVSTQI